jgi:pimeloyl-ACP methyl ester carboxylesterase
MPLGWQPAQSQQHPRWRRIALAAGLEILAGGVVAAGFLVWLVGRVVRHVLHPARTTAFYAPVDVGVTRYRSVQFVTGDNLVLRGWYVPSQNGAAVLLAHGYGDNRVDMLPELTTLARHGYGVLSFDLRGHGQSDPSRVTFGDHEQRDIRAALDFLCAQPDVDPDRIGAIGFSMGGAALACVAAEDARVWAVVLESTYPALRDLLDSLTRPAGVAGRVAVRWMLRRWGVDVNGVRPVDALPRLVDRPVLLIYGDQDTLVPLDLQERMIAAAPPAVDVWRVVPAHHQNFAEVVPDDYAARLAAFFERAFLV